ncbi:hypothetical protein UlMin_012267 [Ulmus minor]
MEGLVSFQAVSTISHRPKLLFSRSIAGTAIDVHRGNSLSVTFLPLSSSSSSIRVQQDGSATIAPIIEFESEPEQNDLKVKEWEVGMFHNEVAASQGIRIRRMPPTRPPLQYVGPFEFRLQNEGNTLRNILEEIIWHKDKEVAHLRERKSLGALKKALDNVPLARDFVRALKSANARIGLPGLIAEVKKASPSRGIIREDFDPVEIARAYEKGGAACLGVLVDEKYFQGSFDNIEAIRNVGVKCPLLCKEFIVEAWQIYYARTKGVDAILLIAAILPDLDIKYMTKICKLLGLATLVEVHDEREMDRVLGIEGIELIGINNRNLVVGESGLFTPDDIAYVQEANVKAHVAFLFTQMLSIIGSVNYQQCSFLF